MDAHSYFERLAESTKLIARPPDYPGKRRVVEDCRSEVEDLAHAGRISDVQGQALLHNLAGACQPMA